MRSLPLHARHQARGATFVERAGWAVPAHYGDPVAEHLAVRRGAGLADLSARGKLWLSGEDRQSFLHSLLSNDIQGLHPGQGTYAALLTDKGKMLADLRVYHLGDRLLLDLEPELTARMVEILNGYIIADDVLVEDATEALALLSVHGPAARELLGKLLTDLPSPELHRNTRNRISGQDVIAVRVDRTGEEGYDLYVPVSGAAALWEALIEVGAPRGLCPVGEAALESLRIEAGLPRYGADMTEETIPIEAGLEARAISYTKGCYIGQEVIARLKARGHVNRHLVGLLLRGAAVPTPGSPILAGERQVGMVTSSAYSPVLGCPIALGYVRAEAARPGTTVTVREGQEMLAGAVAPLPFPARAGATASQDPR